jgi:hypothetical protein
VKRRLAWLLILLVDAGDAAWGGMAAAWPDRLPGPGGVPILAAGYEGFSRASWPDLVHSAPATARYLVLLFRMYGLFNLLFGLMAIAITVTAFRRGERWAWWTLLVSNTIALGAAMTYDRMVHAIGPFELSEYLGLALVYLALGLTATQGFRARY